VMYGEEHQQTPPTLARVSLSDRRSLGNLVVGDRWLGFKLPPFSSRCRAGEMNRDSSFAGPSLFQGLNQLPKEPLWMSVMRTLGTVPLGTQAGSENRARLLNCRSSAFGLPQKLMARLDICPHGESNACLSFTSRQARHGGQRGAGCNRQLGCHFSRLNAPF